MAFTHHPNPEHIYHPDLGWLKGGLPIDSKGVFDCQGHHVEIDLSTGMIGFHYPTPAELAAPPLPAHPIPGV